VTDVQQSRGVVALLAATAIWGTTFATMKLLAGQFSAMQIIALRFGIAVAVLLPLLPGTRRTEWRWGLALGVLLFMAFGLQIEGLVRTSANRNAFVAALNVLIVPLIGLALGQRPRAMLWLACGLALVGMRLLFDGEGDWNLGDSLTLASAFVYAVYIHLLSAVYHRAELPPRAFHLAAVQGVVMLAGAWLWAEVAGPPVEWSVLLELRAPDWFALLYLGILASIVCVALQAWGQRHVPATPSALIYGLEPVFASATALVLLGERLGGMNLLGGALVVASVVLSQVRSKSNPV